MGERVVAAAVRQYGLTVSLPQPARHSDILKPLHTATGVLVAPEDQGFLTSSGRFVGRIEAGDIARLAGQIKKLAWPPQLYSEDLW
jgi:hypothetical protein